MKAYKAPETRIKVVKSEVQTDYWPQFRNWLGFYETYEYFSRYSIDAICNKDLALGSLEYAQAVIDMHHSEHKEAYEDKVARMEHKKGQEVTYFKYP